MWRTFLQFRSRPALAVVAGILMATSLSAATIKPRYYGHETVLDEHGVIAPWYRELNGQCDWRVRIAAETLKRYPWTTTNDAVAAGKSRLTKKLAQEVRECGIDPQKLEDWENQGVTDGSETE